MSLTPWRGPNWSHTQLELYSLIDHFHDEHDETSLDTQLTVELGNIVPDFLAWHEGRWDNASIAFDETDTVLTELLIEFADYLLQVAKQRRAQ